MNYPYSYAVKMRARPFNRETASFKTLNFSFFFSSSSIYSMSRIKFFKIVGFMYSFGIVLFLNLGNDCYSDAISFLCGKKFG